jgi:hypothetical protein
MVCGRMRTYPVSQKTRGREIMSHPRMKLFGEWAQGPDFLGVMDDVDFVSAFEGEFEGESWGSGNSVGWWRVDTILE